MAVPTAELIKSRGHGRGRHLAVGVVSHGVEAAVGLQEEAVVYTCGDRRDLSGNFIRIHHMHGGGPIGRAAVAQLAIGVVAHGVEAAVRLKEEAVSIACGDLGDAGGDDLYG